MTRRQFFLVVDKGSHIPAAAKSLGVSVDIAFRWRRDSGIATHQSAPRVYTDGEKKEFSDAWQSLETSPPCDALANMTSATYNGLGLRTAVTVTPSGGGSRTNSFIWTTTTSTPELLRDSSYAYLYASGGTPFAEVNLSSGAVTYLLSDALGSVRALVSSSGVLWATTSYDAWGNPRTPGGLFLSEPAWVFRRLSRLGERMESWTRSSQDRRGIRLS